jgi:Predicted dehydrogenases and related proteins
MKKRFAVIGYGGQGDWHCQQILKSDVAELAGVYDIKKSRQELAKSRNIFVYDSLSSLLEDESVDAVVVVTPNDSHKELVIQSLKAKKHVICEKPVEMSVQALDEMEDAAKKANKLFTVHQNRRWDVDFLAMKQILTSQEIGDMINIESRVHGQEEFQVTGEGKKNLEEECFWIGVFI